MAEVGKVMGPSGSPESGDKKTEADAKKFEEARRRVAQVSAVDPDEQKKRKRQEEAEEEEALPKATEPTLPSLVPPFMLTTPPKSAGLFGLEQGSSSDRFLPPTTPSLSSPSPYETSFMPPTASSEESSYPAAQEQPQSAAPSSASASSSSDSQNPPASPSYSTQNSSPSSGERVATSTDHKGKEPDKTAKPLSNLEKKTEAAQDTTGFFEQLKTKGALLPSQLAKPPELPITETAETSQLPSNKAAEPPTATPLELPSKTVTAPEALPNKKAEALIEGGGLSAPLSPPGAPLMKEADEKKSGELEAALLEGGVASSLPGGGPPLIKPPESISSLGPYSRLSPQAQELFDKMVGVMTVMHLQGMTETSFSLTSPKFASSVFFGAQIIIKEFSTAPQALNVQLNGSMQAVALFQANTGSLMAAFQAGNYNFKINRLETNYISDETPLFHRKERDSDQQNKDQGDQSK